MKAVRNAAAPVKNVVMEKSSPSSTVYNVQIKESLAVEKAYLPVEITLDTGETRRITLEISSSIVVGRSRACGLRIDDTHISRQHFAVEYENGLFFVTALGSTGGTALNGVKIKFRRKLENNSVISAGTVRFRVILN